MALKKKKYPKRTIEKHMDKDYQLGEDVTILFWENPSRKICIDMLWILASGFSKEKPSEEETIVMQNRFYECVSELIVDTDIEGISFETSSDAEAAFENDVIPWNVFTDAVVLYLTELSERYEPLKKALSRLVGQSTSGQETSQTDKS